MAWLLSCAALLPVTGCPSDSRPPPGESFGDTDGGLSDIGLITAIDTGIGFTTPDGSTAPDIAKADTVSVEPYGCNEPGGLLCTCTDNKDCQSGYCVETGQGMVCTQECLDECPEGFACRLLSQSGSDATYLCLPQFPHLCDPCHSDSDCVGYFGGGNRCVPHGQDGAAGSFCAVSCKADPDCPKGYTCADLGDGSTPQCLPESGECACSPTAAANGLETSCTETNASGTCTGARWCSPELGLSECDAATPSEEECDGKDNDCDGMVDDNLPEVACTLDGPSGPCPAVMTCIDGKLECAGDGPSAEICDGKDNDCDGETDEEGAFGCKTYFADLDADHYGEGGDTRCLCQPIPGYDGNQGGDCDDADMAVHPGALEVCNGKDDNCNGVVDPEGSDGCSIFFRDADGDGAGVLGDAICLCSPKAPYTATKGGDCNDTAPAIYPDAIEKCDGQDDDCNGIVDDPDAKGCLPYLADADVDGYGIDGDVQCLCSPKYPNTALKGGDCNDTDPGIHPDSVEKCDGLDDDCDGQVDQEGAVGCTLFVLDNDGDGYGVGGDAKCLCNPAAPYTANAGGDCNDKSPAVFPSAQEICNGVDDNCNALVDEPGAGGCADYFHDGDGDGFGIEDSSKCLCGPAAKNTALVAGDCDDKNPLRNPSVAELCNDIDDDCNGVVDDDGSAGCEVYMADEDGDGYGVATNVSCLCAPSDPYTATKDGDCDDADPDAHPGKKEACNGTDDDCDGETDEGAALGCMPYHLDVDGDGYGVDETQCACEPGEPFGAAVDGDCDDAEEAIHPSAEELCNGIDDDCDGVTDEAFPCAVGALLTETEPCGACGTRSRQRTCTDACAPGPFGAWSECSGEGECTGGTLDTQQETVPCGSCGGQLRQRSRVCSGQCVYQDWSDWILVGTCSGEGACEPGAGDVETRVVPCGFCGGQSQQRTRSCGDSCGWGPWSDWADVGTCEGAGACAAGSSGTESTIEPCGACGGQQRTRTRSCSTTCLWEPWSEWTDVGTCSGEGACVAGGSAIETRTVSCGYCGTQEQQRSHACSATCAWEPWSEWADVGTCQNGGECVEGQGQTETTLEICGNCGSQQRQRSRSCASSCMWDPWSDWANVGTCQASGVCATGEVDTETMTVPCGNCGSQTRERTRICDAGCGWGTWSEWSDVGSCQGSGICAAGETESQSSEVPCGHCGTQAQERTRTCSQACAWDPWSPWQDKGMCAGSGPCAPGQADTEWGTVSCGYCGEQQQSRTRLCTDGCAWGDFDAWQTVGGCTGSGACSEGQGETEHQTVPCGTCGTQEQSRTRTCAAGCFWTAWGAWQNDGACMNEGVCTAGTTENEEQWASCGACGQQQQTRSRTCTASCGWAPWTPWQSIGACTGEGACAPGSSDIQEQWVTCGGCGQQKQVRSRDCTGTCSWDAWGPWQNVGLCQNEGACVAGQVEVEDQTVGCGSCGQQQQTRSRTCSATCGWGSWGAWQNVGLCTGQGSCSVGQSETQEQWVACGSCGLQQQTRTRSCDGTCSWGGWTPWQNVGVCSSQGTCSPGEGDTQDQWVTCGYCGSQQQTRARTCSGSCSWGSWGSWQNVGSCASQGVCGSGQSDSQTQYVSCGSCGSQQQTRSRTCSGTCSWGSWGSWQNVGSCGGQGVCTSGQQQTETKTVGCGLCGSQVQKRTRTCSATCGWGSWSAWQNSGSCTGQGVCTPGTKQKESKITPCSGCSSREQERSRTCSSGCGWGSWSSWSNVYPCPSSCSCSWNSGTHWRCCGHHKWQYCLSAGVWSGACEGFSDGANQCP